jgi:DNA-binding MarR family transcriptional regulator
VADELTTEEMQIWRAALSIADLLRHRVSSDVKVVSDLSHAEHSVLAHIKESGGALGQQHLADAMFWSKSRLSHQLRRMQAKGLVDRTTGATRMVRVSITDLGRRAIDAIDAAHAASVRKHLFHVATADELTTLLRLASGLRGEPDALRPAPQ